MRQFAFREPQCCCLLARLPLRFETYRTVRRWDINESPILLAAGSSLNLEYMTSCPDISEDLGIPGDDI